MPALAALLMMTAWNMSEPHKWRGYLAAPNEERLLLLLTLSLTVLADLTVAIGVGVGVGLALRLRDSKLEAEQWEPPDA
jgi:SulP family sulfate permease